MKYPPTWIVFPSHLSAPTVRSLCLLFIVEEWIFQMKKTHECKEAFFCKINSPFTNASPNEITPPDKFYFYFQTLLETSLVDGREILQILDEVRIAYLQSRSAIFHTKQKEQIIAQKNIDFAHLWREKLQILFHALTPFFKEARTCENLLFLLLENKEFLNLSLGENTLEKLLFSLFPLGKSYWQAVLSEGFHRRDFSDFLSHNQDLLEILRKEKV